MKTLRAGLLTVGYENGFLRRISYGNTEILRMIYFALRDHNWNTMPDRVSNEEVIADVSGFKIRYDRVNLNDGAVVLEWKVQIEGTSEGTIVFEIDGLVKEEFLKNRAGFCVLHPLSVAGTDCTITGAEGTARTAPFPVEVSPDNPFQNIQKMRWTLEGLAFEIDFEGDLFETEDQRNWGDASYKTFCTPLDKPFPARIRPGDRISQRITFRPLKPLMPLQAAGQHVSLRETGAQATLPPVGIGGAGPLREQTAALVRALRFKHYRIEIFPASDEWVTEFSQAYETAFGLGLPLEVALHLTSGYQQEIEAFTVICLQNKVKLKSVLLLDTNGIVTSPGMIEAALQLKQAFPRVSIGAGTDYNFNELNKNRFVADTLDFVSFSFDPQEHAVDDLTILENAETPAHLIQSARAIFGSKMAVHVSPVTLRKRSNPYATNPADVHLPEAVKADPRQKENFTALWTFSCLCSLAKGGAGAVTFYRTAGEQGILTEDGFPYPVYETLKKFSPFQGKRVAILDSSEPLNVQGITLDGKVIALANMSQEERIARYGEHEFTLRPGQILFTDLHRS